LHHTVVQNFGPQKPIRSVNQIAFNMQRRNTFKLDNMAFNTKYKTHILSTETSFSENEIDMEINNNNNDNKNRHCLTLFSQSMQNILSNSEKS
jgi:hypothetical protein